MVSTRVFVPVLAVLCISCSREKTQAVYNTDQNPDQFPAQAVVIIDRIESGEMTGSAAITEAFGDLYTQHSELLDNVEWKKVIDRLGNWFEILADSLAGLGPPSFSRAAEYYQLSSFGRPEDTLRRRQAALYGCWSAATNDRNVDLTHLSRGNYSLGDVLTAARYFLFRDTLNQQFFTTALIPRVQKQLAAAGALAPEATSQLPRADRGLLALAGLGEIAELGKLKSFPALGIDLIAARVAQKDSATCRAEFYFLPHQSLTDSVQIYLRVDSEELGSTLLTFSPQPATTTWLPGQLVPVAWQFSHPARITQAAVGLCDFAAPRPNFFRPEGFQRDLLPLEAADIVSK
ncbi:MAG: hypothetical protein AB1772_06175 [Candidatus Zixiibacteriota bacterium]